MSSTSTSIPTAELGREDPQIQPGKQGKRCRPDRSRACEGSSVKVERRRTSFDEADIGHGYQKPEGVACQHLHSSRAWRGRCDVQLEFFSRVLKTLDSAWPIVIDVWR